MLSGKVVPLLPTVCKLYIAIDGTGVPMVPRETEGRRGKQESGKAKTREAKIGCVFTQTNLDEAGFPIRDEGSTTYVGAIEEAEAFGRRIYAEAIRRGLGQAEKVIVLGDGAPWIWGIVALHFPFATQIWISIMPRAFGQSGQSRLWAHQCPSQTMGSGLLATTRCR